MLTREEAAFFARAITALSREAKFAFKENDMQRAIHLQRLSEQGQKLFNKAEIEDAPRADD